MSGFSRILVWGAGNMGGAMLRGWKGHGLSQFAFLEPHDATASKVTEDTGARRFLDATEAVAWADLVVLGIKPQVFAQLGPQLAPVFGNLKSQPAVLSIMAGVKRATLHTVLGESYTVARTMPNLPLTAGNGTIALATDGLESSLLADLQQLLAPLGSVVPVQEAWMDAVTAVSGSGPAWVFQFIEGMVQGGVKMGLPRTTAYDLALSTVEGSVALLKKSGQSPSDLTAMVSSPAGTTIYGLHALEDAGFRSALMQAIEAAALRSKALG